MEIQSIWPEPPLSGWTEEVPEIPEGEYEVYGAKMLEEGRVGESVSLSECMSTIVDKFLRLIRGARAASSTEVQREIAEIEHMFIEALALLSEYREREGREDALNSIREKIERKKRLLEALQFDDSELEPLPCPIFSNSSDCPGSGTFSRVTKFRYSNRQ